MHNILIIGEHDGKVLNPATAKCVTCAGTLADAEITIAVFGSDTTAVAARKTNTRWRPRSRLRSPRWLPTTATYSVRRPVSART